MRRMRITEVRALPKIEFGDGLGEIAMSRLGQVIVIAGKNGSGKSRLLRRLIGYKSQYERWAGEFVALRYELEQLETPPDRDDPGARRKAKEIEERRQAIPTPIAVSNP